MASVDAAEEWYMRHEFASGNDCAELVYAENFKRVNPHISTIIRCPTSISVSCVCVLEELQESTRNRIDTRACMGDLRTTESISNTNKHCNAANYLDFGTSGGFAFCGYERAALYRSSTVAPSTSTTMSPTKAWTVEKTFHNRRHRQRLRQLVLKVNSTI